MRNALRAALSTLALLAWGARGHEAGAVCLSWNKDGCFPAPAVSVWPQPREMTIGSGAALGVEDLKFVCEAGSTGIGAGGTAPCDDVLTAALQRYARIIAGKAAPGRRVPVAVGLMESAAAPIQLQLLTVRVSSVGSVLNASEFPELSENYTLSIGAAEQASAGEEPAATLHAATTLGALRGLETFAQLIDFSLSPPRISNTPVSISDAPRFAWRGLRLDTSRHYYPVRTITSTLDAMAAAKLNVLMWHIIDGQSFPLVSELYPELSAKGAYCPQCVYSPDAVRSVVEHARMLGIRVHAEIDVPGHSGFGYGRPDLIACPKFEAFRGAGRAFDPTQDATYAFLKAFLLETAALFPEPTLNLNGDEVQFECWASNPRVAAWASAHNLSYPELEQHFWTRMNEPGGVVRALTAAGKTMVVAEGSNPKEGSVNLSKSGFPSDTIAEVWGDATLSSGIKRVLSTYPTARAIVGGPYYLDVMNPYQPGEPAAAKVVYAWMDSWATFYQAEPFADPSLTAAEKARVLGGVAEMWSERLDATSVASFIWPRALAVAERLWSPADFLLDPNATAPRMARAACQVLERRGVRGGAVEPGFCPWSLDWE